MFSLIFLAVPGGGELVAGRIGRVGPAVTVVAQRVLVLGASGMLGGDGMVQALHAAP